jgi:hypothetical protein
MAALVGGINGSGKIVPEDEPQTELFYPELGSISYVAYGDLNAD